MDIYHIIKRPLVTEKGTHQSGTLNAYAFQVSLDANKTQIKQAIAEIFDVRVTRVNTINRKGKIKRTGWKMGKRADTKRALVTLAVGSSIDIFDV